MHGTSPQHKVSSSSASKSGGKGRSRRKDSGSGSSAGIMLGYSDSDIGGGGPDIDENMRMHKMLSCMRTLARLFKAFKALPSFTKQNKEIGNSCVLVKDIVVDQQWEQQRIQFIIQIKFEDV